VSLHCTVVVVVRSHIAPYGVKAAYGHRTLSPTIFSSVCSVHCGKMADRIWMWFGIIGRMGPEMRQVVWFGEWSMGGVTLGECGVPHYNQWVVCSVVQPVTNLLWAILLLI